MPRNIIIIKRHKKKKKSGYFYVVNAYGSVSSRIGGRFTTRGKAMAKAEQMAEKYDLPIKYIS
jgi:hypothetical protein